MNLTPPYIWNVANYTLVIGIILCIAGLVLFYFYFKIKQLIELTGKR